MTINRLESLVFGVDDVALCTTFLEQWGLEKVESGASGATFQTIENQPVILRSTDDASLPETDEGGSSCREAVWGVDSQSALDAIGVELSRDRDVTTSDDGTLHARDESGYAIGFRVAAGKPAVVDRPRYNYHDQIDRLNTDASLDNRPKPIRLGHVVFGIPDDGNEAAAAFYTDRLNFRVSDRADDAGTFLRCDGSNFHHCLLLYHRGDHKRYNHCAFEVAHIDDLMVAGGNISAQGWETESGPGRHSLGSNVFWYFKAPLGGSIEYFADMDRLDDTWKPRHWDAAPPYSQWMIGDALIRT